LLLPVQALLSSFTNESCLNDKLKRTLNQFLLSSEVSVILGAGLFNSSDKELVVDMLLLIDQCLSSSGNKRFSAYSLAEGIIGYGQRLAETSDKMESKIFALEATAESNAKIIDKLQTEVQKMLHVQDELRLQHDQEMKELGAKLAEQVRQKEEVHARNRDIYETKLRELNAQCESMAQHMNKKMSAIQHRDQLLQDSRTKRAVLEDENAELKRKVQVLEIRIEEIAQSHSLTSEEMQIRERELVALRDEMATVSSDYASKREELSQALEDNRVRRGLMLVVRAAWIGFTVVGLCASLQALQEQMKEMQFSSENTYKELVLLSKAHKAVADQKRALEQEMETLRDDLAGAEQLNRSVQSRLQEKKDLVEQLEKKVSCLHCWAGRDPISRRV
jgi:chromosome segregation ATPase